MNKILKFGPYSLPVAMGYRYYDHTTTNDHTPFHNQVHNHDHVDNYFNDDDDYNNNNHDHCSDHLYIYSTSHGRPPRRQ